MSTKTKLFSASLILAAGLMTGGIARAQTATTFIRSRKKGITVAGVKRLPR